MIMLLHRSLELLIPLLLLPLQFTSSNITTFTTIFLLYHFDCHMLYAYHTYRLGLIKLLQKSPMLPHLAFISTNPTLLNLWLRELSLNRSRGNC